MTVGARTIYLLLLLLLALTAACADPSMSDPRFGASLSPDRRAVWVEFGTPEVSGATEGPGNESSSSRDLVESMPQTCKASALSVKDLEETLHDLEEALQNMHTAIDLTTKGYLQGHLEETEILKVNALMADFTAKLHGEGASHQGQEAARRYLKENPADRAQQCLNSRSLVKWYHTLVNVIEDLARYDEMARTIDDISPRGHPQCAGYLEHLATNFRVQYQRSGQLYYLHTALKMSREVAELTPEDHPDRAGASQRLAALYSDRYERLDDVKDLERALYEQWHAMKLIPDSAHDAKAGCLRDLAAYIMYATTIFARYLACCINGPTDIEYALFYYLRAVNLMPDDHPEMEKVLEDIAGCIVRYDEAGDLEDVMTAFGITPSEFKASLTKSMEDTCPQFMPLTCRA
ncbi:hypothetical protein B0H17DRAFT_1086521 [Mycena rosella]|uniref:Uncharacterized protein n=1 Tax=Mycena rosella TaxID=1033263 RepID=A0AAD7G5H6_MYCRO|nr:hypothetical protein B0H17DRAFT_1086521 [Mycena rosella]